MSAWALHRQLFAGMAILALASCALVAELGDFEDATSQGGAAAGGAGSGGTSVGGSAASISFTTERVVTLGSTTDENLLGGIAVDADDNVYVAGSFRGSADFGSGPVDSLGGQDGFVLRLLPDGTIDWVLLLSGPFFDVLSGIAVDDSAVYVVGAYAGPGSEFAGQPLPNSDGADVIVASVSHEGAFRWVTPATGPGDDYGLAVDVEADTVRVAGTFNDELTLNTTPLVSVGGIDMFTARFGAESGAASGQGQAFGGPGNDISKNIVIEGARYFVTGNHTGIPLTDGAFAADSDLFVQSFGSVAWTWGVGSDAYDTGETIALGAGSLCMTGRAAGIIDLGGEPYDPTPSAASFVSCRNQDDPLEERWTAWLDGAGPVRSSGLSMAGTTIYVSGHAESSATLGTGQPPTDYVDGQDGFLLGIERDTGAPLGELVFGGLGDQDATRLVAKAGGRLWMAGHYDGELGLADAPVAGSSSQIFVAWITH